MNIKNACKGTRTDKDLDKILKIPLTCLDEAC